MLTRWLLVSCLLSLGVAKHGLREDHATGPNQDDHNGEIVIEHRHRPRVHKSFGSGQYVIPAAALLPQHQLDLGDNQGAGESEDYFERGGGEVYEGEDEALETNNDYIEDFNVDYTELYLAESSSTISPATQHEQGDNIEKLGAGDFENIPGWGNLSLNPGKKTRTEERGTAGPGQSGESGESDKVAKKEGSRTALSKLLRLLIAAYI